jgi:hypothetical protein
MASDNVDADKLAALEALLLKERERRASEEPITVIITGVPRCGRDDDGEAPPIAKAPEDKTRRVEDFGARQRVSEALLAARRPPPSTPAPRPVEPAEPLVAHRIWVQVAPPTERDPGAIIEGSYALTENGVLRVYDADQNLLGTEHLRPGADAGAAARRVLREKKAPAQFWNPINYTTH